MGGGGGTGCGQRDRQNCVCTKMRFVGSAVSFDHGSIEFCLVVGVETSDGVRDLGFNVFDRLRDAFATNGVPPSRNSTASLVPVEAPDGTAARPICHRLG